jgi:hypothetical protein
MGVLNIFLEWLLEMLKPLPGAYFEENMHA